VYFTMSVDGDLPRRDVERVEIVEPLRVVEDPVDLQLPSHRVREERVERTGFHDGAVRLDRGLVVLDLEERLGEVPLRIVLELRRRQRLRADEHEEAVRGLLVVADEEGVDRVLVADARVHRADEAAAVLVVLHDLVEPGRESIDVRLHRGDLPGGVGRSECCTGVRENAGEEPGKEPSRHARLFRGVPTPPEPSTGTGWDCAVSRIEPTVSSCTRPTGHPLRAGRNASRTSRSRAR
jgi:hypothetical protein